MVCFGQVENRHGGIYWDFGDQHREIVLKCVLCLRGGGEMLKVYAMQPHDGKCGVLRVGVKPAKWDLLGYRKPMSSHYRQKNFFPWWW